MFWQLHAKHIIDIASIFMARVSLCESLSHVQLFAAPWTVALQAPLFMEFSSQDCGSG